MIDDSVVARRVVEKRLTSQGYRVVGLDSGAGAAAAIAEHSPMIVVMDLEMPGGDGDRTAAALLGSLDRPPPFVIHSSLEAGELTARARACGAVAAIAKTADDAEFLRHFDAVLSSLSRP